jgi:hypothetical protein
MSVTSRPCGSTEEVGSVTFSTLGVMGDHDDSRQVRPCELAGISVGNLEVGEFQSYSCGTAYDSLPPDRLSINFDGHDSDVVREAIPFDNEHRGSTT